MTLSSLSFIKKCSLGNNCLPDTVSCSGERNCGPIADGWTDGAELTQEGVKLKEQFCIMLVSRSVLTGGMVRGCLYCGNSVSQLKFSKLFSHL